MKKLITPWLIAIIVLGLLLSACGGNGNEPANNTSNDTSNMNNDMNHDNDNDHDHDNDNDNDMNHDDMDMDMNDDMDHDDMDMGDVDTSTSRMSDDGAFMVNYTSDVDTVPMNELHTWTLHVETAAGEPVTGATILVDGGMPEHGHGLPTEPAVTEELGNGDYRVEGLKFQMAGLWDVVFSITDGDTADSVMFSFMVME